MEHNLLWFGYNLSPKVSRVGNLVLHAMICFKRQILVGGDWVIKTPKKGSMLVSWSVLVSDRAG
jgi:hypothetical protein